MDDHSNPATRIFELVHAVLAIQSPNQLIGTTGFAKAFGLSQQVEVLFPYEVADRLIQVADEIRVLELALSQTPRIRAAVFAAPIGQLRNLFSPLRLSGNWPEVKSNIDGNSLFLLESFQAALSSLDERKISQDELDAIKGLVDDLTLAAAAAELSPALKDFLRRQIALMFRALSLYPLQGSRAFSEAERVAIGDLYQSDDVIRENVTRPEVREVSDIWKRIGAACNVARGVDAAIRVGKAAWELIESNLPPT